MLGGSLTSLPIGSTSENHFLHRLGAPAFLTEFDSKPIQQLAMDGELTLHAEIFGGLDQTRCEEVLPDAVYLNP